MIVVMLATMSSLPIIAAIGTGTANVGESVDASGTTPFIAPPSQGPVVVSPPPPSSLPADVPLPAGAAEQLRTVAAKRDHGHRRPVRKIKRAVRATESAPAPAPKPPPASKPVEPTPPAPKPTPSLTPTLPPVTPTPARPTITPPTLPLPPSATQSIVPPTGLPTCWPDLDKCFVTPHR